MKKYFILACMLIFFGIILTIFFGDGFPWSQNSTQKTLQLLERNDTVTKVPIMAEYSTKIVYTTDTTVKKDSYINDCKTRGGVFNTCGNPCAPQTQKCVMTCALTCEIKP